MTDNQPYNGSTILVNKIENLLAEKKISTPAAMRLILELKLDDIKQQHLMKERLTRLERASWSLWVADNPRTAFGIIILIFSFIISDVSQPLFTWLEDNIKNLLSLL